MSRELSDIQQTLNMSMFRHSKLRNVLTETLVTLSDNVAYTYLISTSLVEIIET